MTTRKGEFEACFASGLDLSELTTKSTVTTTTTTTTTVPTQPSDAGTKSSHAANLLVIKQAEAAIKLEHDQDEIKLQNLIKARAEQLNQVTANANIQDVMRLPAPTTTNNPQQASPFSLSNETNVTSNSGSTGSSSQMIHNVLVGMHQGASRKGYDNMPRKMLPNRSPYHNSKSSKKIVAKRTIKRKY